VQRCAVGLCSFHSPSWAVDKDPKRARKGSAISESFRREAAVPFKQAPIGQQMADKRKYSFPIFKEVLIYTSITKHPSHAVWTEDKSEIRNSKSEVFLIFGLRVSDFGFRISDFGFLTSVDPGSGCHRTDLPHKQIGSFLS
jgi:hypothetical protein